LQDESCPKEMQARYLLILECGGFTNEQRKGRSTSMKNFRNGIVWDCRALLGAFLLSFAICSFFPFLLFLVLFPAM